jgi:hypothetical protein
MTKLAFLPIVILLGCTNSESTSEHPDAAVGQSPDAPPQTIDAGSPCSAAADTCTGDSICIAGACEAAFGRLYDVRALSVTLPTTDPAGDSWDFGGGAPDIFVTISVDDVMMATTPTIDDQFSATFAGPFPIQPIGGASLLLVAYDEDITTNTVAYSCKASPLTAEQLRARHLACASGGRTMSFMIEPR